MSIVPQPQSFSFTFFPPQVPLLPAPPVRLMLPTPKIVGLLTWLAVQSRIDDFDAR